MSEGEALSPCIMQKWRFCVVVFFFFWVKKMLYFIIIIIGKELKKNNVINRFRKDNNTQGTQEQKH